MLRTIAILLAAAVATGAQTSQPFPHTKKFGRATVEYKHEGLTFVANYDYSQRNHAGQWLLIDVALGSNQRFVVHRDNFAVVTSAGQTIKLATQAQGEADPNGINTLIQNAKIHRQNLEGHFPQRGRETVHLFSLPFSRSTSDEGVVDNDRVTMAALLFRSPGGSWPEGTYRLVLDNERAKAELPISLQ